MDLLMLPGNHSSILGWMEEVKQDLSSLFGSISIVEYGHWATNKKLISLEIELTRLSQFSFSQDYAIFAKSAGILLALKGTKQKQLHPKFCIFIGTPIVAAKALGFDIADLFEGFDCPTLYIQNENDPAGSAGELSLFLSENDIKGGKLTSLIGNTHDYDDIAGVVKAIDQFVAPFGVGI
jgi:hypothetical protein